MQPILWLSACFYIPLDEHEARRAELADALDTAREEADTDTDTDTDADADTDTDTDVDTADIAGGYGGTFSLMVTTNLGRDEECEGNVVLTVNPNGKFPLVGEMECDFGGVLGNTSGTIDGSFADGEVTGRVSFSGAYGFSDSWAGTVDDSGPTITGSFSGSDSSGSAREWDGSFSATRGE